MQTLWQDLRYGARMLLKQPGFAVIAVITLALGIGANTAVFSVINAVLLRPLPYNEPNRLVMVQESLPKMSLQMNSVSAGEFLEYQQGQEVFSEIAGLKNTTLNLTGQGEAQRIQTASVSGSLFSMLGISPLLGRTFTSEEGQAGNDKVVVLSEPLWRRAFGADTAVIGKAVRLDEKPYTVIGIMPARFQFPFTTSSFAQAVDLWTPLVLSEEEKQGYANSFDYGVIGRLKPGVSIEQAQANMEAIAVRFQQQHSHIYRGNIQVTPSVVGLEQKMVKRVRPLLLVLLVAVGLVLLIACANVANLLLARAAARRKEVAIRSAMGASRGRIMRQLMTESTLLAFLGGISGLLLALWVIDLILRFGPHDVPRLLEVGLDMRALGFTLIVSLLTGVLFGLAPALQSSRLDLSESLKEGGGRTSRNREGVRIRNLLVILENASALVLLIGAGLLINSFARLLRVPPGFNPEGAVIARTAMPAARYPKAELGKAAYKRVLEGLSALPGVEAVSASSNLPLTSEWTIGFRVEGSDDSAFYTANNTWISDQYFRAMGITLLKGRAFNDKDRENTMPVVIVNETMARRFWPGQDVIGKRIKWGDRDWFTIVGVAADVKVSSLEAEDKPAVYMPIFQMPRTRRDVIFVVRTSADPASLVSAIRREINAVDAELPVYDIRTMNQVIAESVAQRRFSMLLLAVFAFGALLLAVVGLYGVMSYAVAQRMHEIGIRMALGAQAKDVLRLVLGQGMMLALTGVGIGLVAAFGLTRLMASLLFGVSATDPATFTVISLLLAVVALVASYIPARRATKVDPLVALRYE